MKERKLALLEFDMGWSIWLTESQLPFHIGRHVDNQLRNSSDCISRKHCSLDLIDNELHVIDNDSKNGTILRDRLIKNSHEIIKSRSCLLLSDMLLWVTPCDREGHLVNEQESDTDDDITSISHSMHGVCLVDICDSMELGLEEVNQLAQALRAAIIGHEQDRILLLKHMGDGYLAVFDGSYPAINAAKRVLEWQSAANNTMGADIRITLDSGATYPTYGHDRAGMAICRASRIEKTQQRDMDEPADTIEQLKPRNRCLMTETMKQSVPAVEKECMYMGKRRLKGFADELYPVYQYTPAD